MKGPQKKINIEIRRGPSSHNNNDTNHNNNNSSSSSSSSSNNKKRTSSAEKKSNTEEDWGVGVAGGLPSESSRNRFVGDIVVFFLKTKQFVGSSSAVTYRYRAAAYLDEDLRFSLWRERENE